ncbi:MAG TPA: DUF4139 domain-containing protein [Candidatus Obscuribacter sp.]|nr:DUF4139 domain-containing protein [Candidatus Obscuribacter sp.]HNB17786.1 DUF4139 domain-containing protein [Candidatus Obscuribacter sp.]HND07680.1 DUF4139 domain-containing protein [Candidatus Obscuribacter sp.]HNG21403.1 DUF4139 domain-containing protein [Candidatus Obscuribacter sp.]HNN61820.1 DUF4139 domain-containing protein [Candidatus Obscuribacter sp.]
MLRFRNGKAIAAILALSSALALSAKVLAQEVSASKDVAITVYNQNFGLVKDTREINLKGGINFLRFEDVAAAIDPTTVSFTSLTAPNSVAVREQNYQFDLMDESTILARSLGKTVKFRQYLSGGAVREITGTLLSSPSVTVADSNGNISQRGQSIVVKTGSGIIVGASGELEIAELPEGLVAKPSLLWKLECDKAGAHNTEISYQTQGMNWKCDYVAVANADDSSCDLTSWVTIDNKSGATYKNAALKLMAGDVHKVQQPSAAPMMERAMAMDAVAAEPQFSEQSFAEYHLYSLKGRTDVRDNETKQLTLFNASAVPVKKLYVLESNNSYYGGDGQQKQKVNVKLELANSKDNNLGMPLPKGKVRVYKKDQDGALQFVGEDEIDHTPKDEKVRVYIGDAFDIAAERVQTGQQQISERVQRQSYSISLRNHKKEAVTVTCVEHAWGDWKIVNSSMPYTKKDSHTFEFNVKVAPDTEEKLTYTIEIK